MKYLRTWYQERHFGGRTNALKLYYKCKPNEQIKYVDYTSLYPDVQKNGVFPMGHPKIITENFGDINQYFGLVKCKILPPRGLYLPVLPARFNSKLIFTLCSTCAISQQKTKCCHNDQERAITGTWVTLEVQEALKHGYKVVKVYEIWHYEEQSTTLFEEYVNTFLKFKTEASGLPNSYQSKEQYIHDYKIHEGIELNPNNINKNPGLRSVAKLMLNSFWGRFGMNSNKIQYKIITTLHEWNNMFSDDRFIIHNIFFINDNVVQVFYSLNEQFHYGSNECNVVIAAFVTCQARLKLFREMVKLGERVLYFDTDSIFFISRPNEYEPTLGDFLGQFTNEIDPSEGNYIDEFISAGPKNYSYKLDTGICHCTVKGININHVTSEVLNFESIKKIVCQDQSETISVEQMRFSRSKEDWSITNNVFLKDYRFVYDKRVVISNFNTLPYGF